MGKKIAFVTVLLVFAADCFAGQISVQIVQHNLALDYVSEQSMIVEDLFMNGFFNQGFVVTNSDAAVSRSEEDDEHLFSLGFGEAYDGFSDYFVQIKLFYSAGANMKTSLYQLERIDWVLINVSTGEKLKESSIKGSDKKLGVDDNVRLLSNTLIKEIRKVL